MLSGTGAGMYIISILAGNEFIYVVLKLYDKAFGTIRREKTKVDFIFVIIIAVVFLLYYKVPLSEMDLPGVFSMSYEEMEGVVIDYKIEQRGGSWSTVKVRENKTRKVFKFSYVDIPLKPHRGDLVKMRYLKHNKMGAFVEINGEKMENYIYHFGERSVGMILIVLLLLSMPFYYFWIFKVKPVREYKITYKAYTYHDLYIKTMRILYLFMIQTAIVLIIAVMGKYKTSWDWYWALLLIVDYAGVFRLSFLRQKQFAVVKDKFYYCNFKKRLEGDLSEIVSVEKTYAGVTIWTNKEVMEVLCTSEKYREELMNKLGLAEGRK